MFFLSPEKSCVFSEIGSHPMRAGQIKPYGFLMGGHNLIRALV